MIKGRIRYMKNNNIKRCMKEQLMLNKGDKREKQINKIQRKKSHRLITGLVIAYINKSTILP